MSKGRKLLILVVLVFACSWAFGVARQAGLPQVGGFFAFMMLGLTIAIFVIGLSRDSSHGR